MSRIRALAARVLHTAERDSIFVDEAIEQVRGEGISPRDRAFLTHLVYGVTRRRLTLDYLLRKISGVRKIDRRLLNPLRIGLYEMHYLDGAAHAAVNEAVEAARKSGTKGASFVNAVLRKASTIDRERLLPDDDSIRYSIPGWMIRRWKRAYPGRVRSLLSSCNRILPVTARVNRLRTTRNELDLPPGTHPDSVVIDGPVGDRPEIRDGLVSVQDETAMDVAPLLEPEGKRIIDLCASPGGKATHAAELGAKVLAVDISRKKIERVRENAGRLGLDIDCMVADGRTVSGRFDAVLLDAPCSNTGVLMRRPDARWRLSLGDIADMARLQVELLDNAVLLAPLIVYSTCSIEPEENEKQVESFLARHDGWSCDYREVVLPGERAAGGFSARFRYSSTIPS